MTSVHCVAPFISTETSFGFTSLNCNFGVMTMPDYSKRIVPHLIPQVCVQSCHFLKFLSVLDISSRVKNEMRCFQTIIRNCKNLESIEIWQSNENALECLQQIPNPLTCQLKLASDSRLTSSRVLKLAGLLPRFNNLNTLDLDFGICSVEAVVKLVSCIKHRTLELLTLRFISLTQATAAALGRSLPKLTSLKKLVFWVMVGSTLQVEEMEALLRGYDETFLALNLLDFSNFNLRGCLAPLSFRFFPGMMCVSLDYSNLDEHDFRGLVDSLEFNPCLTHLSLRGNPLGDWSR